MEGDEREKEKRRRQCNKQLFLVCNSQSQQETVDMAAASVSVPLPSTSNPESTFRALLEGKEEENPVIPRPEVFLLDFGSGTTKFGWAGEDAPRVVFPTVIVEVVKSSQCHILIGNEVMDGSMPEKSHLSSEARRNQLGR